MWDLSWDVKKFNQRMFQLKFEFGSIEGFKP